MQHSADSAQHVNRADDERAPAGEDRHEAEALPGAEEDGDFASEVGEARQATTGERRHHQGGADEREPAEEAEETPKPQTQAGSAMEAAEKMQAAEASEERRATSSAWAALSRIGSR